MKNLSFVFLFFSLAIPSLLSAQIRKIPSEVTDAFHRMYPEAENVEWRDRITQFAAEFELKDVKYEARYDNKGKWIQTEHNIEESDLPADVRDGYAKSKYADWKMEAMYKVELPDHVFEYRIVATHGDIQKRNLLFNAKGRLLKDKIAL